MESAIFILYFWFRILFQSSSSEFYDFIHIKKWRFNGWSEGFWVLFLDKYPRQGKGILINFGSESTQLDTGSLLCVCDTCEWSSLKIIVRAIKQWLIVVINQNVRENSSSAGSVATADINNNQIKSNRIGFVGNPNKKTTQTCYLSDKITNKFHIHSSTIRADQFLANHRFIAFDQQLNKQNTLKIVRYIFV